MSKKTIQRVFNECACLNITFNTYCNIASISHALSRLFEQSAECAISEDRFQKKIEKLEKKLKTITLEDGLNAHIQTDPNEIAVYANGTPICFLKPKIKKMNLVTVVADGHKYVCYNRSLAMSGQTVSVTVTTREVLEKPPQIVATGVVQTDAPSDYDRGEMLRLRAQFYYC